jgi:cobalamin biosynthesis protein CobT
MSDSKEVAVPAPGIAVSLFETEVIGTARTFGRDGQVKVVFEGTHAKTNEDTVTFPALDHSKPLTHNQVAVGRGYVDHEAAHLRHTDMPLFQKTAAECKARGDRLATQMVNAIEDCRIERITIDEYPGAFKNLIATTEETAKHFIMSHGKDPKVFANLKAIGPIALTWIDRKSRGYVGEHLDMCIDSLDPEVRKTVEGWAGIVKAARGVVKREVAGQTIVNGKLGTEDSIALAKRFVGETRNPVAPTLPSAKVSLSLGSEGGSAGSGGEVSDEDATPQEEYSVESSEEVGTYSGAASGVGSGVGAGSTKLSWHDDPDVDYSKEPEPADVNLDIGRVFATHTTTIDRRTGYRPFSTADDKWHYRRDAATKYLHERSSSRARILRTKEGDETYARVLTEAGSKVSVMKRKLERALLSKTMRGWESGKEDGRLDSRRLALAARGHTNVFKARDEVPEIDTAVEVLIDLSGSMSGKKAHLAMQSAILVCEALDGTGVAFEVTGFNNTTGWTQGRERALYSAHGAGQKFSRTEPIDMYIFKHFDETLREGRRAMGNISRSVAGNNSDSECVELAYNRLAVRPEKRHVMLVLSDGYPAVGTDYEGHLENHLRQVIANISAKHNTQLVGLGINSDAVKQFYPKWVLVENLDDLTKNVLDQIGRMLLGERFIVDNSELIGGKHLAAEKSARR